jgi:hypothetical protein
LIEGIPYRRDHIDATGVEGGDTLVIMTAGTAVMAVAAVAVTACAAAVEGAAAVDVTVASVASKMMEAMILVSVSAAVADVGVATDEVAGTEMSLGGVVSFIEGAIGTDFTPLSVLFISSDWTAGTAAAADAVAGAVADATVGMSVGTEMSSGDVVLDTGGIIGADFTSLSISFAALGSAVATTEGASVLAGMSDGTVSNTGGVVGANFSSLFVFLNTTVAAAVDSAAAENSVTGALVGVEKSDNAIFDADGIFGAIFASLSVSFSALERFERVDCGCGSSSSSSYGGVIGKWNVR